MDAPDTKSLPANAYQPLAPGEAYRPVVPAAATLPEATPRSIGWGLLLCVVFTVASAYSGLKVGQVMEAAIPISILAIGLARVYARRSSLLENMIITGIGGVSGAIAAGAIFTLPALYILKLDPHPVQTIFICLAGACLGRALPDPAAPLLRARDARPLPVSRGDRDHRGAGDRRERRLAGPPAAAGDRHRRASTTSSSRRSTSGTSSSTSASCRPSGRWPSARASRFRSTRSPSSSGSAT